MFNQIDINKNGKIDYEEWVQTAVDVNRLLTEDKLEKAFRLFDVNNDNRISLEEINSILSAFEEVDPKVVQRAMNAIKKKQKPELMFHEFKAFMIQLFK